MGYTRLDESVQPLPQEEGLQMRSYSDSRASLGNTFTQYTAYDPINTNFYPPPAGSPPDGPEKGGGIRSQAHEQLPSARVWAMNKLRSFILAFDVVFHSTPMMFIVLALIAARIDGKEVSQYGKHLQQVLLLSPTIFPVIFAALMGRCFKYMGLYLAERGTTLGRLEQLIGSTSLFSAMERQLTLRKFSAVGYILTILWLLSPLGGQSALRLMGEEINSAQSNGTVQYLNPDTVIDTSMGTSSGINSQRSSFSPIFLASLLSSSKYQDTSMDLWGNVKMPHYASLEDSTPDDWKTVGSGKNVTYASLIGIPVAHVPDRGTSNFSIKARQWDIKCDKNEMQGGKKADFGKYDESTWKLAYTPVNSSCTAWPCSISLKSMADNEARDEDYYNYTVASCKLSYEMYETRIGCKGRSCAPTAIRKTAKFVSDNYTEGADAFFRITPVRNAMISLPKIDNLGVGSVAFHGSSNAERWMADPTSFVGLVDTYAKLYELSPEVLSNRLTILWNSFFQATYAMNTLGGTIDKTFDEITQSADMKLFNGTATTITTPLPPVWRTNWKWFTALLVSSIFLQIAAFMALFFKYYTCVPDIIGYASSMTLLNPYVPSPTGGTTLHGLERTRMLQDMKVMIGDVCADEPVGAVAFARADTGKVARLTRKRFYV